ncbi:HTH psq-type domain-containing protein, partial [Aphis craccivora]
MVGKSKKRPGSRPYKNFSNDTLVQAVQDCKNGVSYRKVAEKYGISKSTLQRKVVKKHCQPVGRPTVLSEDD